MKHNINIRKEADNMLYLEDLKYMKLYKKKFYAPINKKNKKTGSAILLLTPNYDASKFLMNNPFMINRNAFISYYIEKDITYTINHESKYLEISYHDADTIALNEQAVYTESTDVQVISEMEEDYTINELYCKLGDSMIFFNELYDETILNEKGAYAEKYRKLLYYDRIRNNRDVLQLYKKIKEDNPWIKKTFIDYKRYKSFNLFIDLYYYNQIYLANNNYTIIKSIDMYLEFIRRFLTDKRIDTAGYTKKTIFIPVNFWGKKPGTMVYDYKNNLNPISIIYKKLRLSIEDLHALDGLEMVFFGNNGYFKFKTDDVTKQTHTKFLRFIKALEDNETIDDSDEPDNSPDGITTEIIDKLDTNRGIKIHNLTGNAESEEEQEQLKAELVKRISDASKTAANEDDVLDNLENDEFVKKVISDLGDDAEDNIKISAARATRITKAQDNFMKKSINNKSVKDMVNESNKPEELPETELPIETINEEWKHMKAINFEKEYDLDADIIKILNSLSDTNKEYPVSILDVKMEDTSTSEDSIYTYTVKCEDYSGKRFTLKFDIPKFRDNRFMRLRGNEKIFSIEMPLIPISKTDEDTVQIVSFYNKIFIERYNTSTGKSNPDAARFIKAMNKYSGSDIKVSVGDNTRICSKYELPIDYVDLASMYSKIEYSAKGGLLKDRFTIYFNQDELRKDIKNLNESEGLPVGLYNDGRVIYYVANEDNTFASFISTLLGNDFYESFKSQAKPKKCTYSRASILNTNIPVITILAHDLGLTKAMDIAGIDYDISEKRAPRSDEDDTIKLADGFIHYKSTYTSMMLMNGLKDCNMEDVQITELNSKITWVNILENFGGRIKSDGLTNFKDLMYDPITVEVSRDYKLPDNYHNALVYASNLLVDNKFTTHTDISTNRYRTNEVVAAQFYRVLSDSYKEYALQNKHGRKVPMSMKQSAVIDLILAQNTTSDLSVFQPLLEIETKNTISTKGVTGMNSERAYKIDKRGYDDSMVNVIAQATGFASTVGVNRQTTINPNIVGGRGYFKQSDEENMSVTNTLCMTEALSPFVVTSDDPFRNDMTFVQTAKHSTPIDYSTPMLVTTGADAAMPYLCSNMFAAKAKSKGTVKEVTKDYMIIQYDNGEKDYINLDEQTMKNSDGGFYISLQLKTDLKEGSKVKEGEVVAYDSKSFSKSVGDNRQLAYNMGCMIKAAVMTTEDGFEDSGKCSEWLTEAMSSDIVVMKDINLPPSTNVLFLVKKGSAVKEGEPILIFQNAYDEEDANVLLKNLNNEDGDVSEIGRNVIKSKVTGVISDIKIYRTCEIDDLSDSLKKIVKSKESEINRLKSKSKGSVSEVQFDSTEKLPQNGKLKNLDGVRIEIYMKYHDPLSVGDKIVVLNANKNVLMDVYDDKDAPYTDYRPNEAIDQITSASSMDGRMITSIMKTGALNKLMIELARHACEMSGLKWKDLHEIREDYLKNNQ
jgi:hypothetical protein